MQSLKYYNEKIIKYDFINKFNYNNINEIPALQKITLNFGCKNFTIQKFATTLLALEIITTKKGTLTIAQKPNLLLKIQKGQPAGCKVILNKKLIYNFLTKLLLEVLPKLKNFIGLKIVIKTYSFSFQLSNNEIVLKEFEEQYPLFSNLPKLDLNFSTNSRNQEELLFLIKSLKFPVSSYIKTKQQINS